MKIDIRDCARAPAANSTPTWIVNHEWWSVNAKKHEHRRTDSLSYPCRLSDCQALPLYLSRPQWIGRPSPSSLRTWHFEYVKWVLYKCCKVTVWVVMGILWIPRSTLVTRFTIVKNWSIALQAAAIATTKCIWLGQPHNSRGSVRVLAEYYNNIIKTNQFAYSWFMTY